MTANWTATRHTLRVIAALAMACAALVSTRADARRFGDEQLYQHVADRVAAGEGYYQAVAVEHRTHGFSVRPFIAVRPPALAYLDAWLPLSVLAPAALALCIGAWVLVQGLTVAERAVLGVLLLAGGWLAFIDGYAHVHEFWAGLLIAGSIALYRANRWWPSLAVGALALLLRELALAYVLLAAAFAIVQRRRAETAAWIAVVAVFCAYMVFHAWQVHRLPAGAHPLLTSGWLSPDLAKWHWLAQYTLLRMLPEGVQIVLAIAALAGWLGLRNRFGVFAFLYLTGMAVLIVVGSRSNNLYWTFMLLPAWFGGLAFWPRLLREGLRSASRRRRALVV